MEVAAREAKTARLEAERWRAAGAAEEARAREVEEQVAEAYRERVEMARKCLEKEEEVTAARRSREEAEERARLLQAKNK